MRRTRNSGFSLIELLVAMTITLVVVVAAALVYLNLRETDSTQTRVSDSVETGTFALQQIGRDIAQAGSYPILMPVDPKFFNEESKIKVLATYETGVTELALAAPYRSGIFGCDGGKYNSATQACDATTAIAPYRSAPDSIVINYFSSDPESSGFGNRIDCTGTDVKRDGINTIRQRNENPNPTTKIPDVLNEFVPPYLPLFVSNRYGLNATSTIVEGRAADTLSLSCNGNGQNDNKAAGGNVNNYQPSLLGIEDMQVSYGVFSVAAGADSKVLSPTRFYTATEVAALPTITYDKAVLTSWDRVVSVRLCLMTKTMGGNSRIADATGSARKYLDCADDVAQDYAAGDRSIRQRHIQTISLRNRLTQAY